MMRYVSKENLSQFWGGVKSWINSYLTTWKQTNFGSGTYSVGSGSSLTIEEGHSLNVGKVITNDSIRAGEKLEFNDFQIVYTSGTARNQAVRITKPHGFMMLVKNITGDLLTSKLIKNESGSSITVLRMSFFMSTSDGITKVSKTSSLDSVENGSTLSTSALETAFLCLLFWY